MIDFERLRETAAECLQNLEHWTANAADPQLPLQQLQKIRDLASVLRAPSADSTRIVLFAGPAINLKMPAAQALAHELQSSAYRVDLSGVASQYIGETEKNLAAIFTSAPDGQAILFFDEGDALFGKRSDVKDSHDRYENLEIGAFVQRASVYRGVIVLACKDCVGLRASIAHTLEFDSPAEPNA
jgi:SpoVK/Ycf46/Vps4 family AAA+-type ATPase